MNTIYLPARQGRDVVTLEPWTLPTIEFGYFHSPDAVEVWLDEEIDTDERDEWTWEKVELTTPLDPEPWRNHRTKERAAFLPQRAPDWHWDRRGGYETDSALYAVRGGLDPFPYLDTPPTNVNTVPRGRTRWPDMVQGANRGWPRTFAPREGFEQNQEKYR